MIGGLSTAIVTGLEVAEFPDGSRATAVSVWDHVGRRDRVPGDLVGRARVLLAERGAVEPELDADDGVVVRGGGETVVDPVTTAPHPAGLTATLGGVRSQSRVEAVRVAAPETLPAVSTASTPRS